MNRFEDFGIHVAGTGEVDTTCPECSPKRKKKTAKCLGVNTDKGTWLCHHCGWSGGLGTGTVTHDDHWKKPKHRKPTTPKGDTTEKLFSWFKSRGISDSVVKRNKIARGLVYMPQVEDRVYAVQFPYYRDGELVNVKYRDKDKNFRMEAGAERILYGLSDIQKTTIIVEGEMDKLSLEEVGFLNCVSVPDGAPSIDVKNYESKFSFLDADKKKLDEVEEWIIAVDNDPPGQRLEDELSRRFGREKCKRVIWPQGCKDANEVLTKLGADVLADCIFNAQPYPIKGVFDIFDISDKIDHLYTHGLEKGKSTGYVGLDDFYTVRPGEFTVVTGIPNSGKSNWMDALMVKLAKMHGWNFGVFSPENQPLEDHAARIIEKWTGFPFRDGPSMRLPKDELPAAKKTVGDHFHWILHEDDSEWTLENILESARALVYRYGIRGLIIDPWNELEHNRPSNLSETEYISQSLKKARQFGRVNGVHVWIVAHPAKLYKDKDGQFPIPTPYDISGSAHWRNKADNCITIWRDFGDLSSDTIEVHIQKIRFRQIGKLGMCEQQYNHIVGTYGEPRQNYEAS